MTYTASDVPGRADVLINGEVYRYLDLEDVKGISSFAPTFLQRTNVSDAYGDEDQDWWLTMGQRDWSLGEGQRYSSVTDPDSARRYWLGEAVDVNRAGQVTLLPAKLTNTAAAAVQGCFSYGHPSSGQLVVVGGTNAYLLSTTGSFTSLLAHGCTTPYPTSSIGDGEEGATSADRVILVGGTGQIRAHDGTGWSNFDATHGVSSAAYLNNTYYGIKDGVLYRWSSAGARTTLFSWQSSRGNVYTASNPGMIVAYGGDIAILLNGIGGDISTLWIYDGVAPAVVAQFTRGFLAYSLAVVDGALLIGGIYVKDSASAVIQVRPAVFAFTGGGLAELWSSETWLHTGVEPYGSGTVPEFPFVAAYDGGAVWNDDSAGLMKFYRPSTGAITTLFAYTVAGDSPTIGANSQSFAMVRDQTTVYQYPNRATTATSGYITTSLFDGSTTRTKRFKSVVVEFDAATDGNGGTVDIAYRLNDVDGSYTSVQSGATSGTEYAIGQNGRAISIKVTLNKGTSTLGPRLKRIYVRAAPLLDTFRKERYVLDLSGVDGEQHVFMRDGQTVHPKDGLAMATDLRTAIASTSPISITDEFGTYNAYLVPEECEIRRVRSQEYVAVVTAREV